MTNPQIGDSIEYDGRTYIVRGFSPRSVVPPHIVLEDTKTRAIVIAPVDEVQGTGRA